MDGIHIHRIGCCFRCSSGSCSQSPPEQHLRLWRQTNNDVQKCAGVKQWIPATDRDGPGVVSEGRGSEYTFAGGIVINSMLAGFFIMPISFAIGLSLSMRRAKQNQPRMGSTLDT